jgi:hypothetical protein
LRGHGCHRGDGKERVVIGMPQRRKDRLIRCQDLAGRRHELIVFVDCGRVVLIAPPAETAVLTPEQVGALRAALRDTLLEAARQQD